MHSIHVVELDVEHIVLSSLASDIEDIIAEIADQAVRIAAFNSLVQRY